MGLAKIVGTATLSTLGLVRGASATPAQNPAGEAEGDTGHGDTVVLVTQPAKIDIPAHPGRTLSPDFAARLSLVAGYLGPRDAENITIVLQQIQQGMVLDVPLSYAGDKLEALQVGKSIVDTDTSKVPPEVKAVAANLAKEIQEVRAPTRLERITGNIENGIESAKLRAVFLYLRVKTALLGLFMGG